MLRRLMVATVLVGSIAPLTAGSAGAAAPSSQSTSCSADLTVSFRPGLTLSEQVQQIRGRGSLSGCVGGGVTSATAIGTGSGSLSCLSGTASATIKVRWNTGETSTVSLSIDVGSGSVTGTVVAGKFLGESATGDLTIQPVQGDCLFNPVTLASATGTIAI